MWPGRYFFLRFLFLFSSSSYYREPIVPPSHPAFLLPRQPPPSSPPPATHRHAAEKREEKRNTTSVLEGSRRALSTTTSRHEPDAVMQRMSLLMPSWDRTRSVDGKGSSGALSRVFGWADKTGVSRRSTVAPSLGTVSETEKPRQQLVQQSKFGREAYWPSSLEKECEKAARILKSFCSQYCPRFVFLVGFLLR